MAQIGTIKVETQSSGTVEIPVFDAGDAGTGIHDMLRVQTASGVGFVPLAAPAEASRPYIRVQTQNNGVLAVHHEASLSTTMTLTSSDLDGAVLEDNTTHESVANTDHNSDNTLRMGLSHQSPSLMNGLVGWWPLTGQSGKTADFSGSGNHGTVNGATRGVAGRGGLQAFSFDGTDDYVATGYNPSLSSFTLMAWIKTTDSSGYDPVIAKDSGSFGTGSLQFLLDGSGAGTLYFDANDLDRTNLPLTGSTSVNDGNWHHVAVTYDGSTVTLYVDASTDGSASSSGSVSTGGQFRICQRDGGGTSQKHLSGIVVDSRIYNRALSASEIQTLYDWGNGDYARPNTDGVAYYPFSSSGATDAWGTNDGTVNGATYLSNGGPRGDGAYSFDGTDDNINTGYTGLGSSDTRTYSVWYYPDDTSTGHVIGRWGGNMTSDLAIWQDTDGTIQARHYTGSSEQYITAPAMTGKWRHLVLIWNNSTGTLSFYTNGTKVGSKSLGATQSTNDSIFIGEANGQAPFNGLIDDVRIYDYALEPWEVHEIYRYGTFGVDLRDKLVRA